MANSSAPPSPSTPGTNPSLDEMLEILDAAAEMRRDRDRVAEQLNFEQVKARLRERLVAAARASGEPARPEEIDAAIEQYFSRMHAFRDPPLGPEVVLAHVYVRRHALLAGLAAVLGILTLAWFLFLRPSAPLTLTGRTQKAVARLTAEIDREVTEAAAMAQDPAARSSIEQLKREASSFALQKNTIALDQVRARLDALGKQIEADYVVEIVREPGRRSGIDTYYTDAEGRRIAGYYLIVEARRPGGGKVPLPIRNEESGQTKTVTTWAERVPKEVYDRVAADKRADGRVDDYVYAVKRRGWLNEEIRMKGPDGQPLARLGQITEW